MTSLDHDRKGHATVRPLTAEDVAWLRELFTERWGGVVSVSRGVAHGTTALPGFVALLDGERAGVATYRRAGVATYRTAGGECERARRGQPDSISRVLTRLRASSMPSR
ncbi:hypothetical protein [Microbispora bryophytorum]|uniref:GNAT family N-acetyltransferase n=1 Tax=Microbispora bryophytorum subsp. camponoti TaxID=1677852 RepID=A0ABR8KY07_9ACTN|nr:hypothetical protein [Microbispora camponoti]MBD3143600.1 hypothetical protein [Microbispora camponoti]